MMNRADPFRHSNRINRRLFLGTAALSSAAIGMSSNHLLYANRRQTAMNSICCFAKPLQHLGFDELAEKMAQMGFQGIEATVRRGGQVEPTRVQEDLPRLVKALANRDLKITIMASDINTAEEEAKTVLQTAADLGIQRYRMKYFRYDLTKPVTQQIKAIAPKIQELANLNRNLGVTALYQNHAGAKYFGAPIWDLYHCIKDISPEEVAVAFDIRHATVEGGQTWPLEFHLVQSHLDAVYVKDFAWTPEGTKNVPLGKGRVDPRFFQLLKKCEFSGPISLHMEYIDHRDPKLILDSLAAIDADMKTLSQLMN